MAAQLLSAAAVSSSRSSSTVVLGLAALAGDALRSGGGGRGSGGGWRGGGLGCFGLCTPGSFLFLGPFLELGMSLKNEVGLVHNNAGIGG